ncbi:hypothetical protein PEC18_00805 [Paucibacter sp. O1-1]|nr:hypothetical protein [Paucibacter sp. O1-1]MDA3824444.1 hypothetical protein [Paucibacter sp. O1-1]
MDKLHLAVVITTSCLIRGVSKPQYLANIGVHVLYQVSIIAAIYYAMAKSLSHFAKGLETDATPMAIHSGFNEFNHVGYIAKI